MRANSTLSKTSSDGSAGFTGSLSSGFSPWRSGTGVSMERSIGTSIRADGATRRHEFKTFGGSLGSGSGAQTDFLFAHPSTGKTISMRALLASVRDAGLNMHPWGDAGDAAFIQALSIQFGTLGHLRADGDGPDDSALRCSWFGVDRARFSWDQDRFTADPFNGGNPFPEADDQIPRSSADSGDQYGYFDQVLRDIAHLRGTYFREGLSLDLTWNYLFLDQPVPQPAVMEAMIRADNFAVLHRFWVAAFIAALTGTKLTPTVFIRGGGEGLNPDTHAENDPVEDPATASYYSPDAPPSYGKVRAGRSRHHASAVIPSAAGWDEWYWAPLVIGFRPPLSDWTMTQVDSAGNRYQVSDDGTFVEANQRFALNAYNGDDADPETPARADTYLGLVALRKSLALAAFGRSLGAGLLTLEAGMARHGLLLSHILPHIELGAEMDAQWAFTDPALDDPNVMSTDPTCRESSREYARFHAVLAAAIRSAWPSVRIKTSELASASTDEQWAARTAWLGTALSEQLATEAEFLNRVSEVFALRDADPSFDLDTLDPDTYGAAIDWYTEASAAGIDFPAPNRVVAPHTLVQATGIHYFRYWGAGPGIPRGYLNKSELLTSILDPLRAYVLQPCAAAGIPLQWGVGNVGFPSGQGSADAQGGQLPPPYLTGNSQELQAGHLVRLLLTFVAYGASHVLWYAHMEAKETAGVTAAAGVFTTMGLRNDEPQPAVDDAETDAWQKASWWTYQRLATLMARASGVDVIYNIGGLVVLRIVGGAQGLVGPDSAGTRWRYGYVFWIDGAPTRATIRLGSLAGAGLTDWFERVPLVPEATAWAADNLGGYAESGAPEWDDAAPGDPLSFGHCAQAWIAITYDVVTVHGGTRPFSSNVTPVGTLPSPGGITTLPGLGITLPDLPDGTPAQEPRADVEIRIARTVQDNFGLVVWLCDTTDISISI